MGRWADNEVVAASVGKNSAALLGTTTVTSAALAARLRTVRTVHDLDTLARSLPGCFHLVASIGGRVRAQGTVSTACQLFYGRVDGVTVAADRPQTIASMTGAGVDEELLALQLLTPFGPPWPLNMTSVWRGVRTLLPGHYLDIRADGTERTTRYWTPPDPELPLEPGVAALSEALETAVAARTSRGATISADLSGGKDSTSLCFLAARHDTRLVTVHAQSSDPANEDRVWAARCADRLPHARHLVVPMKATPGIYAEVANGDTAQPSDTPLSFTRGR
ncbi:asparagine synthase-related protein [Streptomyces indonesiensis]